MTDRRDANTRLDGHERLCTERWGQVRQQLKAIWWLLALSGGTVITTQAAIIMKLWK